MSRNPFQQLYVGEKVDPSEFVDIFSHELVRHAMPLFQPGHVILSGIQGSGKSMLFKLFQSEVRLAYASQGMPLPIPEESARFIGAGINVNQSRCRDFGKRRSTGIENMQELMFGDFFNYIVAADIVRSVKTLSDDSETASFLGLKRDSRKLEDLVRVVATNPVWEGYLESCVDTASLVKRFQERIAKYRRYMNGNDRDIDGEVFSTKTSAGEPLKVIVKAFKDCEIVPRDVEFFILVDQYEELATIKGSAEGVADFRSVVNSVIDRDPTLSYRLGTRGYAWRNHLNVFGADARLEEDRDFKLVDLDAKLRNSELGGTNVFPSFARDVFERRVNHAASRKKPRGKFTSISNVLDRSPDPDEQAKELAGDNPASILRFEDDWASEIKALLGELASQDPLSAKLGEAWVRQKGPDGVEVGVAPPWEQRSRQWWRKERVQMALLLIAGIKKQRAILYGEDDILALSGGNILLFLSLCQNIWESAFQAKSERDETPDFPIKAQLQTIGIFRAARAWLDRVPSDYGRSDDRYKLIQLLGERFSTALHADLKMSNPGHTGISFSVEDLRNNLEIFDFLIEAVDYGNLIMSEHATKDKNRKRRYKFYLNPLYCPIYRIPHQRSKEPIYISIDRFKEWLSDAKIIERLDGPRLSKAQRESRTAPLLDLLDQLDA